MSFFRWACQKKVFRGFIKSRTYLGRPPFDLSARRRIFRIERLLSNIFILKSNFRLVMRWKWVGQCIFGIFKIFRKKVWAQPFRWAYREWMISNNTVQAEKRLLTSIFWNDWIIRIKLNKSQLKMGSKTPLEHDENRLFCKHRPLIYWWPLRFLPKKVQILYFSVDFGPKFLVHYLIVIWCIRKNDLTEVGFEPTPPKRLEP